MTKISVENMGPIVSGEVDLKPLTIFIGPSNTGKSYMATAIYALMKAFEGAPLGQGSQFYRQSDRVVRYRAPAARRGKVPDEVYELVKVVRDRVSQECEEAFKLQELTVSLLSQEMQSFLKQSTLQRLDSYRRSVTDQLRWVYGDPSTFVRRGSAPEDFGMTIRRDVPPLNMSIALAASKSWMPEFDVSEVTIPPFMLAPWLYVPELSEDTMWDIYFDFFSILPGVAAADVLGRFPPQSFYLPAARSGIAQGHKVVAAELIRQNSRTGPSRIDFPALPGITTEFLSNLVKMDKNLSIRSRDDEEYGEFVSSIAFIESNVLNGTIDLDDSGGLPFPGIVYEPMGRGINSGKFALDHTSSMVSELAPLILFLVYLVSKGDLLILEEPESHLHPAAQRQMARGIVRLVNAGVKVLITTHSDLLLSAVNNLMRLSFADDGKLSGLGFEREDCLSHDDVSAYRFAIDETQGGSLVHELEIRRDVGIDDAEFGKVVNELYDETIAVEQIPIK